MRCRANADATGSNPVEAPKILFFWGGGGATSQFATAKIAIATVMATFSFHLVRTICHLIAVSHSRGLVALGVCVLSRISLA